VLPLTGGFGVGNALELLGVVDNYVVVVKWEQHSEIEKCSLSQQLACEDAGGVVDSCLLVVRPNPSIEDQFAPPSRQLGAV
jgi:hypothetical protein